MGKLRGEGGVGGQAEGSGGRGEWVGGPRELRGRGKTGQMKAE